MVTRVFGRRLLTEAGQPSLTRRYLAFRSKKLATFASNVGSPSSATVRCIHTSMSRCANGAESRHIRVLDQEYSTDDYTNLSPNILSRLTREPELPKVKSHPLHLLCARIQQSMPGFKYVTPPSPVVSVADNFDSLGIAEDHPGRAPSDTYYVNRQYCLRTHTSTHEVQTFSQGHTKWLLAADVYRRDEIDASHYPVFHQMEGACVHDLGDYNEGGRIEQECQQMEHRLHTAKIQIEDQVDLAEAGGYQDSHLHDETKRRAAELAMRHLKATLNNLVLDLFSQRHAADSAANAGAKAVDPLKVRWIAASFPFTSPSFEIEVLFRGKWLEILGCGVVMQRTLDNANVKGKLGWAFGLGLERIAMILFQIPDIRLFWSKDPRFISQFAAASTSTTGIAASEMAANAPQAGVSSAGGALQPASSMPQPLITFKPYSRFPSCYKDVSFWLPKDAEFHDNDAFEVIRDVAGDLVEDVVLIDEFKHPKKQRTSKCFRVNYRSMDRSLENEEINALHGQVTDMLVAKLNVEIR